MMIRSGGPGALTSLFVRGGESDYNKVLLDGIPLNEPGGSFYFNNLTTENLDRVEIVRGAYSSLFGSDAMASVIQLFTRRPDGTRGARADRFRSMAAPTDTVHANASVSGATVPRRLLRRRRAVQHRQPRSEQQPRQHDAQRQRRPPRRSNATLRVISRGELEHVGTPGPTAFGRPDLDAFFDRSDVAFSVSFDQSPERARSRSARSTRRPVRIRRRPTSFSIRRTRRPSTGTRQRASRATFLDDLHADLHRHHASYQADSHLAASPSYGDHRLTLIADWDGERATQEDRLAQTTTAEFPRQLRRLGAASDALAAVLRDRRRPHRAQRQLRHRPGAAGDALSSSRGPAQERFGETRLKASAGTGIKEPTMLESFSLSPFFLGNPDLKPERSRSVEVGDRSAPGPRSGEGRGHLVRQSLQRHHLACTPTPATFEAQYLQRRRRRAPAASSSASRRRRSRRFARARRLHVPRFGDRRDDFPRQRAVRARPMGVPASPALGVRRRDDRVAAPERRPQRGLHRQVRRQRLRPVQSAVHRESRAHHVGDASRR